MEIGADATHPMEAGARTDERLALIFAHPDDETFSCAGTMAAATSIDLPVSLISATRGERGESGVPGLDDPEVIGAVREEELRAAAAAVGVVDVRFLTYRDSGMEGTPENDDPRALVRADERTVAAVLAVHLRAIKPTIVLTFGPDGVYGHPDHLVVFRAATEAVRLAADPAFLSDAADAWATAALYYNAVPREEMLERIDLPGSPMANMPPEQRQRLGRPRAEITTWLDVSPWFDAKVAAIRAHRTQTGSGGPLATLSDERWRRFFRTESYVRVPLPWDDPDAPDDRLERIVAAASGGRAEAPPP